MALQNNYNNPIMDVIIMLKLTGLLFFLIFTSLLYAGGTLQKGDVAPNFELKDNKGKLHKLENYKGKIVALYFYPKDDTPGCTKEACNLRDNFTSLLENNIVILGISYDDSLSHQRFIDKYELPFPLLSDTKKEVAKAYGSFRGDDKNPLRITAVIDEEGKILHTITEVEKEDHAAQILAIIKNREK